MYTYQRAAGIYGYGPNGPQFVDISQMKCSSLMKSFTKLNAIITNSFYPGSFYNIDLFDYYNELVVYDGTFQSWLNTKADVVLNVSTKNIFKGEYTYAPTLDLLEYGFVLKPGDTTLGDDMQDTLRIATAPDIRLWKNEPLDYDLIARSALITINGHFTRVVPGKQSLYILNGSRHFKVYDNIHIGAINFNKVSTLKTVPIRNDQIFFDETNGGCHIRVTFDEPIIKKKVWFVLAGKLYTEDVVSVIADNSVSIRTGNTNWARTLFSSQPYIDLEPIISKETQVLAKSLFKSKDFYYNLLTHSTSFAILFDNPYISTEVEPLQAQQYPASFLSPNNKFRHPFMLKDGMFPSYITRDVGDDMLVDIDVFYTKNFLADTTNFNNGGDLYHNVNGRHDPVDLPRGQFFKIRCLA